MKVANKESGFAIVEVLVGLVVAVLVGLSAWHIWHDRYTPRSSSNTNHGSSSTQKTGLSTLTGMITESPTTPTCSVGQSCSDIVADHTIQVLDRSGKVVATTKTNSSGSYTVVNLAQGQYMLKLIPYIGVSDRNYPVSVGPGVTRFNIVADTGIR